MTNDAYKTCLTRTEGYIRDQRWCMPCGSGSDWISTLGTKLLATRRWPIAMCELPGECLGGAGGGPFHNQFGD